MLRGLNTILYQFRASYVKTGQMMDFNSVRYQLYPLSENAKRMMRFSASSSYDRITPYEVSDFLFQLASENLESLRKTSEILDSQIKEIDRKPFHIKLYNIATNPEYLFRNRSKKRLQEKENFILLSTEYLKKTLKIVKVSDLPVGLASNFIYAAGVLKIDISGTLQETLVPLISEKIGYLHTQGIIEAIWGLLLLEQDGKEVLKVLVNELKSRKVLDYSEVITSA